MGKVLKYSIFSIFIISLLVMISFLIIRNNELKLRDKLLDDAYIISSSIDADRLKSLSAGKPDLNSQFYQDLKKQLFNIRTSNDSYKYLYLLGMKEDKKTIFFYTDSQKPDSPDYVPPGEIYSEVSDEYIKAFKTKKKMTVGPVTDRWGTMITALIPIVDDKDGKLIAVLGLDILDNKWQETIYMQSLPMIGFIAFIVLASIIIILNKRRSIKSIKASEEKFKGLFTGMSLGVVFCEAIYDESRNMIDCIYRDMNSTYEKYTGLNKEIAIGCKTSEMLPGTEQQWFSTFGEIVRTGKPISFEMYNTPSKKHYSVFAYRNKIDHFVAIFEDVTERKANEKELIISKAYLDALNKISDISFDSVSASELQNFVEIIGKVANASRTYLFKNHKNQNDELLLSQVAEYVAEGIKPEIDNPELQNLSYKNWLPRWEEILKSGEMIEGKVADFPEKERAILEPQGIISLIVIPIFIENTFWGFVGFDNCENDKNWDDNDIKYLKIATSRLENAIELITKQKLLEAENSRFKALSEATYEAIFISQKGICIDANEAASSMFACSYEDLIGIFGTDVIADESKELVKNNMLAGFEEPYEAIAQRKDGSKFHAEFQGRMYNYNGKKVRITAVRDITRRKKSNEQIRKLSKVVKTTSQSIVITDLEGSIIFVNKAFIKNAGFDNESEIIGKSIYSLTNEQGVIKLKQEVFPKIFDKGSFYEDEIIFRKKDNTFYPAEVNGSFISNEDGNPEFLVAMFSDISERKLAEKQLKKALKIQTALIQEIYHRTKNNMAVISAMLSMEARRSDNEFVRTIFKEVINKIRSMSLVHQKLYEAKDLSKINLKDYIEDLANLIMQSYGVLSEKVQLKFDLQDIKVLIDSAVPLGLIINELVSNIFKHAFPDRQEGEILIYLFKEDDDTINLVLNDNGVGFPQDFNPRKDGSMGLVSVFSIVENQLKGEISVKSENGLKWHIKIKDDKKKERI